MNTPNNSSDEGQRRTKRRYAHELYPHPAEDEVQPLAEAVPYLYAQAVGWDSFHSGWLDDKSPEGMRRGQDRIMIMIGIRAQALLADALAQGLTGQDAWEWAEVRNNPEGGEWIWERAVKYGVDPTAIKPYLIGDEPDHHDHIDPPDARGWRTVHSIAGRESDCPDCTEPVASPSVGETAAMSDPSISGGCVDPSTGGGLGPVGSGVPLPAAARPVLSSVKEPNQQ